MNRLIAIKLLWEFLCYWCYPSISIGWSRLWIISNTLDPLFEAFVIWCSVSYTRYTLLMHQIYLFVNSRLDSSQPSPHASNRVSEPKPSRRIPVKPGRHWPTRLWPSSSSQYPDYPMRKLTSSQGEEADCVQPASQPHQQPWCSKVVNPTLQQVDDLQIG